MSELRHLLAFRAFLLRRVARYTLGEILIQGGNAAPAFLKDGLWQTGLWLNPYHIPAAVGRAQFLAERNDPRAHGTFEYARGIVENRGRVSASDLALTLVPQTLWRRFTSQDAREQETRVQEMFLQLAARNEVPIARVSAKAGGDARVNLREQWGKVEQEWTAGNFDKALQCAAPLVKDGVFVSPRDILKWTERWLALAASSETGSRASRFSETSKVLRTVTEKCLDWAQRWTPEWAEVWELRAEWAKRCGETVPRQKYLERAAGLKAGRDATIRHRMESENSGAGQLLVLVTEDHELWEERGTITQEDVQRLLVDKSNFAAEHFAPWTHMVEVGSTLALLDWAAERDTGWTHTRDAVRAHLVEQVKKGNDSQPHLHAFNLPESPEFPFELDAEGLHVTHEFLLTAEEHRKDFARAYTPQERIDAVAGAVARLERLAHAVNPNYRPVFWRTGQLEFGDDADDRAWSAVALLRAGLFADSDLPKQTFAGASLPRTAFFASLDEPYQAQAGGEILQFPVTSNVEGDFLTDANTLRDIARRTAEALRNRPGVHVVTLLTHDKFINARRGADEFRSDEDYNEWKIIRAHLDAWREAGAERVTAQEAVKALLDEGAARLIAWLSAETWTSGTHVRYTLQLLGKQIPVSKEAPQWVLVTIPPFLRETVRQVRVWQGERELTVDPNSESDFWIRLTVREPVPLCGFELNAPLDEAEAALHLRSTH